MHTEAEHLASLPSLLKHRIFDPSEYIGTVRGKSLRQEFKKFTSRMERDDELWEWESWGTSGPRDSYSMGWCIVRRGVAIASHCHSHS
jgi:hypothetical protein